MFAVLSTSLCHSARESFGWINTIPAEWQARQLVLIAAASLPPGNSRPGSGNSTSTDRSVVPPPETELTATLLV